MTVDSFPHCVWEKIIPLSVVRPLPNAFHEWAFRHDVRDLDEPVSEPCSLKSFRDHHQIHDALAKHTLRVWSERIFKFGRLALDHCRCLSTSDAQKKLVRLILWMRGDSLC